MKIGFRGVISWGKRKGGFLFVGRSVRRLGGSSWGATMGKRMWNFKMFAASMFVVGTLEIGDEVRH